NAWPRTLRGALPSRTLARAELSSDSRTIAVDGTVTAAGLHFGAVQLSASTDYAYQFTGGTIQIASGGFIEIGQGATKIATNYRIDINSALAGNDITIRKTTGSSDLGLIQLRAANTWTGTLSLEGSLFVDIQNLASSPPFPRSTLAPRPRWSSTSPAPLP
uniref:hypothetical protein n=1 Tax=Verrucomicrobium spinosum TaxID=2736 RepID=UPI00155DDA3B